MWTRDSSDIKAAQRAVGALTNSKNLVAVMGAIVDHRKWEMRKSPEGTPFTSFGQFAVAPRPSGLGVSCEQGYALIRFSLVENGHYVELADLVDVVTRRQGRPSKSLADGDVFFTKAPTSYNSVDRILLNLKRDPVYAHLLSDLNAGRLTPRQAAIQAGLPVSQKKTLLFDVCDLRKAERLKLEEQVTLLCELFSSVPVDVQCTLLERLIEPLLGGDLARRWREAHRPSG
jgi:hypothetical protein